MVDMSGIGEDFFDFIDDNLHNDVAGIALSGSKELSRELLNLALTQIEVRRRHLQKFEPLIGGSRFIFPDKSVAEQASNALVAMYNASLIPKDSVVADLTAGLGMDTLAFSRRASKVFAVEKDENRARLLKYNCGLLGVDNVTVICGDGINWLLNNQGTKIDVIYLDPARRTDSGNRKFSLEDYEPNILPYLKTLRQRCRKILIKVSPLLDLQAVRTQIEGITAFHIVEYRRDCKEVLIEINLQDKSIEIEPTVSCVNFSEVDSPAVFVFKWPGNDFSEVKYLPTSENFPASGYIYEPSPSVMKAGCYNKLAARFPTLRKLAQNTHLFYSEDAVEGFPGRRFQIVGILNSRELKRQKGEKINVISRNYPASADEITRKYKFQPKGNRYLIACKVDAKPMIIETLLDPVQNG